MVNVLAWCLSAAALQPADQQAAGYHNKPRCGGRVKKSSCRYGY